MSGAGGAGLARAAALLLLGGPLAACAPYLVPPEALHPLEPPPPQVAAAVPGPLLAGAAAVDLTPSGPVFLAGFGFGKPSEGVHDPITARALALQRGELVAIIIGCDLIGLHHHQVEEVRRRLAGHVRPEAVLLAATHQHAGPDTLGLWGYPPLMSGVEPQVLEGILAGIVRAAERALAALGPVEVRWAETQAPSAGISKNRRDPDLIDRTLTALAFDRPDGTPVATLVHYACHPEVLGSGNVLLSADFPGALYRSLEAGRPGSTTVFLNGALGGMVTPDQHEHSFAEAERIGAALGELALSALRAGAPLPPPLDLACTRRLVRVPVQNRRYHLGSVLDLFGARPFLADGYTWSEVMALRLGPATLVTAPGEVLPRLGFELDALIEGSPGLLVGLGNDELGYLLHEEDWEADRFRYERTVSPGPLTSSLLRTTARAALRDLGRLRAEEQR